MENQTQNIQWPTLKSKWILGDYDHTGQVVAVGSDGIVFEYKGRCGDNESRLIDSEKWQKMKKVCLSTKTQNPSIVINTGGPSLFRRLRNGAILFTLGTITSAYTAPLVKSGVAFLVGLFAQWLK